MLASPLLLPSQEVFIMKNIRQWQRGFGTVILAVLGLVSAGAVSEDEPAAQAETGVETSAMAVAAERLELGDSIPEAGQDDRSEVESPGGGVRFCSLSCLPCISHCPAGETCQKQCF
jgi:hypothetical protein